MKRRASFPLRTVLVTLAGVVFFAVLALVGDLFALNAAFYLFYGASLESNTQVYLVLIIEFILIPDLVLVWVVRMLASLLSDGQASRPTTIITCALAVLNASIYVIGYLLRH